MLSRVLKSLFGRVCTRLAREVAEVEVVEQVVVGTEEPGAPCRCWRRRSWEGEWWRGGVHLCRYGVEGPTPLPPSRPEGLYGAPSNRRTGGHLTLLPHCTVRQKGPIVVVSKIVTFCSFWTFLSFKKREGDRLGVT